jgi:hypothetical protein
VLRRIRRSRNFAYEGNRTALSGGYCICAQRHSIVVIHAPQVNPYEPYIDYFSGDVDPTPIINAPEPKRRFIPSKHEEQK